jgi:hypothetical protein
VRAPPTDGRSGRGGPLPRAPPRRPPPATVPPFGTGPGRGPPRARSSYGREERAGGPPPGSGPRTGGPDPGGAAGGGARFFRRGSEVMVSLQFRLRMRNTSPLAQEGN